MTSEFRRLNFKRDLQEIESDTNWIYLDHFTYAMTHCLNNTPTRFGARRRRPQGVPS